jgi:hypothetical protein
MGVERLIEGFNIGCVEEGMTGGIPNMPDLWKFCPDVISEETRYVGEGS